MPIVMAGIASLEVRMSDVDLLKMGIKIAKAARHESIKEEESAQSSSMYIVEKKDPDCFNPQWSEIARFKDNMFKAISYAKDHEFTCYNHLYRVIQKKNGIDETVWHS